MSEQIFEDKSIEAALEQAATALGVPVDELDHELLDEKAGDFWGLGETVYSVRAWRRGSESTEAEADSEPVASDEPAATQEIDDEPAVVDAVTDEPATEPVTVDSTPLAVDVDSIPVAVDASEATDTELPAFFRVDSDDPVAEEPVGQAAQETAAEVAEPEPEPEPAMPPTPSGDRPAEAGAAAGAESDANDVSDEATDLLDRIFETMGFDCAAQARLDGETLQIAITGDDNQYLLDGRGRGLSALELILNHAFRHRHDRAHRRVRVDAGDFRSQRDDEIRDMAYQVAHQAKETNSPQQTGPLNPYERRIVHLTLAEDSKVETRSIGNGFQKAVNVMPTSGGRRR